MGAMATYIRAGLPEVAAALAALTGEPTRWQSAVPVRNIHEARKPDCGSHSGITGWTLSVSGCSAVQSW